MSDEQQEHPHPPYTFTDMMPKYAGGYQIGGRRGLQINLKKKPIWLHRKMMLWCFGWEWVDTEEA